MHNWIYRLLLEDVAKYKIYYNESNTLNWSKISQEKFSVRKCHFSEIKMFYGIVLCSTETFGSRLIPRLPGLLCSPGSSANLACCVGRWASRLLSCPLLGFFFFKFCFSSPKIEHFENFHSAENFMFPVFPPCLVQKLIIIHKFEMKFFSPNGNSISFTEFTMNEAVWLFWKATSTSRFAYRWANF